MGQTLISLLLALLLAYWRPWPQRDRMWSLAESYFGWVRQQMDTGQRLHGLVAWGLAVIPLVLLAWLGSVLAGWLGWLATTAWNVAVLYVSLGYFVVLAQHQRLAALLPDNSQQAGQELARQLGRDDSGWDVSTQVRLAIERLFLQADRSLLGVALWFILLSPLGPAGPMLYCASLRVAQQWQDSHTFAVPARQIADWLEAVSARVVAVSFAIVGDFEDALYCWRTQARAWGSHAQGIVLASAAGALGIRLGEPVLVHGEMQYRPQLGMHDEAGAEDMHSAAGLVWRALALWLAVLLLMSLARWTG